MLLKNVYRTLKKQYILLILLGVIIVLSSLIYTAMDYGITGVLVPTEEYFLTNNQEDFVISTNDNIFQQDITFINEECSIVDIPVAMSLLREVDQTCYYQVLNQRTEIFLNEYEKIKLESREFKDVRYDVDGGVHFIRVLKDMDTINLSYIIEGSKPILDNEIAVSEVYASSNNLMIGDVIRLYEKDYTISGYVLFPDYNLMMLGSTINIDNTSQTIGLLSDTEFDYLYGFAYHQLAGTVDDGYTEAKFEEEVINKYRSNENIYFISNIELTVNNPRSGAVYADLYGGQAMGVGISMLISLIALMIVGIMVSKVLNTQRGPIGILKSLGYYNSQIALPYIFFISVMALPSIFLGYFIGLKLAEPLVRMITQIYLLPNEPVAQNGLTLFIAVIVPFTFIVGLSYLLIMRMLRKKPVDLLNPQVATSNNKMNKLVSRLLSKLPITSKLRHLLLYRNMMKFVLFLIGMFYAAFLILLSLGMNGIFDRVIFDYYENTDHQYIGYCIPDMLCDYEDDAEPIFEFQSVILGDEEVTLAGLDQTSDLHPIFDNKGNNILSELEDGIIITKSLSVTKGFKIGDELLLEIGEKSMMVEILDIANEYTGNKIYINRGEISELLTGTLDFYNTVYSQEQLDENNFIVVINTDDIMEQTRSMQGFFNVMIWAMVLGSVIIGGIIIYILTVLSVEDNFYNISLFKVLGYNNNEINKMVLGGYLLYGIIVFVLAVPVTYFSFMGMEIAFAQMYDLIFPLKLEIWHIFVALSIYIVIFLGASSIASRNLKKVSLQEAMKMYQI